MAPDYPPIIDAYRDGWNLVFYCQHCERDHFHGVCDGVCGRTPPDDRGCGCPHGSGDGHRVAHCHDQRSPYDETGYMLRELAEARTQKPFLSFWQWLCGHRHERTPTGDLARDVLVDSGWPTGGVQALSRYERHLYSMDASPEAVETLRTAWDRYLEARDEPGGAGPLSLY